MLYYFVGGSFIGMIIGAGVTVGLYDTFAESNNIKKIYSYQITNKYRKPNEMPLSWKTYNSFVSKYNNSNYETKKTTLLDIFPISQQQGLVFRKELSTVTNVDDFLKIKDNIKRFIPEYSLNYEESKNLFDILANVRYVDMNIAGTVSGIVILSLSAIGFVTSMLFYFNWSKYGWASEKEEFDFMQKRKPVSDEEKNYIIEYKKNTNEVQKERTASFINKLDNTEQKEVDELVKNQNIGLFNTDSESQKMKPTITNNSIDKTNRKPSDKNPFKNE